MKIEVVVEAIAEDQFFPVSLALDAIEDALDRLRAQLDQDGDENDPPKRVRVQIDGATTIITIRKVKKE